MLMFQAGKHMTPGVPRAKAATMQIIRWTDGGFGMACGGPGSRAAPWDFDRQVDSNRYVYVCIYRYTDLDSDIDLVI